MSKDGADERDLAAYCEEVARRAKRASAQLGTLLGQVKNDWLKRSAAALREGTATILQANARDLAAAPGFGLTDAETDRLRLTPARIEAIASALSEIAGLPDPVGEVIESAVRPNGLEVSRVRVPLGVVFFIYESRPNVTADAAAICVKSGNAVILRGGKEAAHSSAAIVAILRETAAAAGVPTDAIQLVDTPDRAAVGHFLKLHRWIDVAIPRGGESLIRRVAAEATMPVIKHFDGNCHVYVDQSADLESALRITINAKCQRFGVCNAAESLLVHQAIAAEFLPGVAAALAANQPPVELRGDEATRGILPTARIATEDDYFKEYLGPVIAVKVVAGLDEAIDHINHYGSHHTDAIVTRCLLAARQFTARVDSAAVLVNASTRFNDGGELGLGAEIGISTDKFHARGPCGLRELTSYKFIVIGDGHVRS